MESDIDEGPIKNQLKTLKIFPGELEEQRAQQDAINDGFRVIQGELVSFYQHQQTTVFKDIISMQVEKNTHRILYLVSFHPSFKSKTYFKAQWVSTHALLSILNATENLLGQNQHKIMIRIIEFHQRFVLSTLC